PIVLSRPHRRTAARSRSPRVPRVWWGLVGAAVLAAGLWWLAPWRAWQPSTTPTSPAPRDTIPPVAVVAPRPDTAARARVPAPRRGAARDRRFARGGGGARIALPPAARHRAGASGGAAAGAARGASTGRPAGRDQVVDRGLRAGARVARSGRDSPRVSGFDVH